MKLKVYIAGPMTYIPHFNFPAFIDAAIKLRELGYDVTSPEELDNKEDHDRAMASPDGAPVHYENGKTWGDFLSRDVKLLSDGGIDAVFVLPGWRKSRGARLETFVASAMNGKPIYCYECAVTAPKLKVAEISPYSLETAWAGREHDLPTGSHA